ncbi:MAG: voltage-gated potassium channel protein [Acidobacteriota bacterium]|nr:voltage-gated potassium channel protein [Acidobacteriota bacterium]
MADFAPPEGPLHRFRSGARGLARISRARYWYPHAPLALALAFGGFLVLLIVFGPLWRTLLADFPSNLLRFPPSSMPFLLIALAMLIMSVGLLFRSRFAWIIGLVLPVTTILIVLRFRHAAYSGLVYYDGALLVLLLLSYRTFNRSSLAAGTLFAITGALLLLIYAVFGSLYIGSEFSPPIRDLVTAFYYSVVTMGTVGYGDITPRTPDARLFTVSIIILGIAVFATSITAIAGPVVGGSIKSIITRGERTMSRSDHFVIVGATPLAFNTYSEFKKRNQTVTLILPQPSPAAEADEADVIIGDANSLEILRKASAEKAKAVLAMRADDSENAFIALAVKELKGKAKTVVVVNDSKHMQRVRLVQPDIVIAPQVLGGEMLAMALTGERITTDFILERFLHSGSQS